MLPKLKYSNCLILLLGSVIQAFGIYNIHALSNVTEGGVLGLTLLLKYWFEISAAFITTSKEFFKKSPIMAAVSGLA